MIGRQMSIAQNHRSVRVAEKLANGVERHTQLHQASREVMPQIMEAKVLQFGSLSQPSPPDRPVSIDPSYTRKDS
jgi:hypothetical protein